MPDAIAAFHQVQAGAHANESLISIRQSFDLPVSVLNTVLVSSCCISYLGTAAFTINVNSSIFLT